MVHELEVLKPCTEMGVAIFFFKNKIWHFRGETRRSPSHKTTKLQHLEINIDIQAVLHIQSLPCTKIRGCVSDKLQISWGLFSISHVRMKLLTRNKWTYKTKQTKEKKTFPNPLLCDLKKHEVPGKVCFHAAIPPLRFQKDCHKRSHNCVLIQKCFSYLFCSVKGLTSCSSLLLKSFTE